MRESTTYQAILAEGEAEGKAEEARAILLHQGRKRFGPAPAWALAVLEGIREPERLELLCDRLLDVSGWDELLAGA